MSLELNNLEKTEGVSTLEKLSSDVDILSANELNSRLDNKANKDAELQIRDTNFAMPYGMHKLIDTPFVQDKIALCKSIFSDGVKGGLSKIEDVCTSIKDDLCNFYGNKYEDIKDTFTCKADELTLKSIGDDIYEARSFGLDVCANKAKEIFSLYVINEWPNLSLEDRKQIAGAYANEVSQAFELTSYKGVYFEDLGAGVLGYNNGDGSIHIDNSLLSAFNTPLEVVNTITHELRHQYQSECVKGDHNVSDEVRLEWAKATEVYTTDAPWAYDPWGYTYNPLEIDARYAGETVVRDMTKDFINEQYA